MAVQALRSFIDQYDRKKHNIQEINTCTILNDSSCSTYSIPNNEKSKFFLLYANVIKERTNDEFNILERVPAEKTPILIDIDLKQSSNKRIYTIQHIKYVLEIFKRVTSKYFNIMDQKVYKAYVLEKQCPIPGVKTHFVHYNSMNIVYRDGIHIVYPYFIVDRSMFKKILNEMNEYISNFEDVNNPFATIRNELRMQSNNILDITIPTNNWHLYGSGKSKESIYTLTRRYNYKLESEDISQEVNDTHSLIRLFSVQNKHDMPCVNIKKYFQLSNNNNYDTVDYDSDAEYSEDEDNL
jgi:hypothetical protein